MKETVHHGEGITNLVAPRRLANVARVLVVDDMATNRELIKAGLRPPEFEITEARDGEEALAYLSRHDLAFDVVLLDIMMPKMDGIEVCRRVRNVLHMSLLPIIVLTTLDRPDDVAQAMEAGASEYLFKPFNMTELRARVKAAVDHKRFTDLLDNAESVLFALARMVEAKDDATGDHCDRLSHMSVVFGQALGLNNDDLQALRRGGILHDIGKLGIPDAILLKPGPLDDQEWVIMRKHTVIGERLCSSLSTMQRTAPIIRCHHEKWNGSGYPDGLSGEQIPLLARIFQIVDVYDALSSVRPYKKAFEPEKVIRILEEETAKGFWDAKLIMVFLDIVRRRPKNLEKLQTAKTDSSKLIYDDIEKTGVLDWARKIKSGAAAK